MSEFSNFIGIDVGKDRLDVCVLPAGRHFHVPNDETGYGMLLADTAGLTGAAFTYEASGGYERGLGEALAAAGRTSFQLHPADVRAAARLNGRRAKTDRIDAELIARAGAACAATRHPASPLRLTNDLKELLVYRQHLLEALTDLKGQRTRCRVPRVVALIEARIAATRADIVRLEAEVETLIADHPTLRDAVRRLRTAPGVGPILAATLMAQMSELGRLSSRQAASLAGVAPHPRQSGQSNRPGRCQGGRARLRRVLYMAALAAIRSRQTRLRTFFDTLRQAGKPFKLAIVAVMRKLIVTLNAMIKNGKDWIPDHAT